MHLDGITGRAKFSLDHLVHPFKVFEAQYLLVSGGVREVDSIGPVVHSV